MPDGQSLVPPVPGLTDSFRIATLASLKTKRRAATVSGSQQKHVMHLHARAHKDLTLDPP